MVRYFILFLIPFYLFGGLQKRNNISNNTLIFSDQQLAKDALNNLGQTKVNNNAPDQQLDLIHFPIDNDGNTQIPTNPNEDDIGFRPPIIGDEEPQNDGSIDSDDDVPTLISIREKLIELSESQRGYRKTVSVDENGSFIIESDSNNSLVTLSDIHEELQKFNLKGGSTDNITQSTTDKVDEAENQIDTLVNNFTDDLPNLEVVENQGDFENFYVNIPDDLVEHVGFSTLNIFNPKENFPDLDIPSLSDLAQFVSLVIGLIAVFIYTQAIMKLARETISQWITSNESNAVTNYSILGNSVGAVGVKALKVTITLGAIGASFVALGAVLVESIDIQGNSGSITDVFTTIQNTIIALGGFADFALYWFLKFAPIISIVGMFGQYWTSVFTLQAITLIANRSARLAS